MGDSLSAGYGLKAEQSWPSLLARRLAEKRSDYSVTNLSISGETTAGGLARLDAALARHQPGIVVIALGANDGLRGLPLEQMRGNLGAMIDKSRQQQAQVLLIGMRLPPNYGPFARDFHNVFGEVAKRKRVAYVDFLLDPIAARPELFQRDQLHPVAEAQPMILDHLWPAITPLLK